MFIKAVTDDRQVLFATIDRPTTMDHFADRLMEGIRRCGTPLIVGIDPRWDPLPGDLKSETDASCPEGVAAAFARFGCGIVDVVAGLVAAVKPQVAFFEALGPPGMQALKQVIDQARDRELLVILDGKRNDIGSTAEAYARGWLGSDSPWGCDALTVNAWMGEDSMQPFLERARQSGSGLFVLVRTSNPGSYQFQELACGDRRVYQHVADWVQQTAAATRGQSGYGLAGAVVGATHPEHLGELRKAMPNTLFLVPGYGAQGGRAADLASVFDSAGQGAVINSSRAIIFAANQPQYAAAPAWQDAVRQATLDAREELAACVQPRPV